MFGCFITGIYVFFWLTTDLRQLRTLKFTIYSLNSSCLSKDRYQHEMEAKYVSQPKPEMTWHPRSIPAGHRETRELRNDVNSMRFIERNHNLVPRVSLLCLHCHFSTTMEAEKRDPGNEVDATTLKQSHMFMLL